MRRGKGEGRIFRPTYRDKVTGGLKRVAVWYIRYTDPRKPKGSKQKVTESSASEDRKVAAKLLRQRLDAIDQGRPTGPDVERTTLGDLRRMIVENFVQKKRRSMKRLKGALAHLVGNDEGEGGYFLPGEKAATITEDRITSYVARRIGEGAENGTINRELTSLKRMFRLALRSKKVASVPSFEMLAEATPRSGFVERHQLEAILAATWTARSGPGRRTRTGHLPAPVSVVVLVAYLTGWRVASEILTRQWRHVDLDAGFMRLEPGETKNGKGRMFPLFPELRDALEQQRRYTDDVEQATGQIVPWVFHRDGEPIRAFRGTWEKACKAAGLPALIPHDLRRSAVRNLERAGVPRSTAMEMVGHKTESVYKRYAIVDETMLKEGAEKLGRMHEAAKLASAASTAAAKGRVLSMAKKTGTE